MTTNYEERTSKTLVYEVAIVPLAVNNRLVTLSGEIGIRKGLV